MNYTRQGPFTPDGAPGLSAARLNAVEDGIIEGITKAEAAAAGALTAINWASGFSAAVAPHEPALYWMQGGVLHIQGQATKATAFVSGETVCTLPVHPSGLLEFPTYAADAVGPIICRLQINPDGTVQVFNPPTGAASRWLALTPITFRAT